MIFVDLSVYDLWFYASVPLKFWLDFICNSRKKWITREFFLTKFHISGSCNLIQILNLFDFFDLIYHGKSKVKMRIKTDQFFFPASKVKRVLLDLAKLGANFKIGLNHDDMTEMLKRIFIWKPFWSSWVCAQHRVRFKVRLFYSICMKLIWRCTR